MRKLLQLLTGYFNNPNRSIIVGIIFWLSVNTILILAVKVWFWYASLIWNLWKF